MPIRKSFLTLMILISMVALTSCAAWFDDGKPCTPVTVKPNPENKSCSLGGKYCGSCEGQICEDVTWPSDNKLCTSVYIRGGGGGYSCRCDCK